MKLAPRAPRKSSTAKPAPLGRVPQMINTKVIQRQVRFSSSLNDRQGLRVSEIWSASLLPHMVVKATQKWETSSTYGNRRLPAANFGDLTDKNYIRFARMNLDTDDDV